MIVDRWTSQLDEITNLFKKDFSTLSAKRLDWKPNNATWSIAQNLHHLIVINESYIPVLKLARQKQQKLPWISKFDFVVNFIGNTVLKAVDPGRRKKVKTFSIWEPSSTDLGTNIFVRFEEHQAELKKLIANSLDLVEQKTVIVSPANKNLVYKLDTAFDILVTHERRHYEQAKESLNLRPA
ncbi:MAG: DinB family protein [Chitinophagaceae bacterium]|nr:DinB family protein [Chitinophagaceae bacterium]